MCFTIICFMIIVYELDVVIDMWVTSVLDTF